MASLLFKSKPTMGKVSQNLVRAFLPELRKGRVHPLEFQPLENALLEEVFPEPAGPAAKAMLFSSNPPCTMVSKPGMPVGIRFAVFNFSIGVTSGVTICRGNT